MRLNEFEFYPERAFQPIGGRNGRLTTLYGGKNDTPAPDPRLVDAQIRSLGIQEDAINRMLSMSEDLAPLQRQQLEQTIQQSRDLWAQNQEDREFALGKRAVLSGIQDRIAGEASRFSEADRGAELAGRSDSDVAQAFAMQRGAMDRDMTRMGVNPNDGRSSATKGAMAVSEALARVQGRTLARDTARTERLQLDDRANNALSGYPSMTMGAQGQGVSTMGAGTQAFLSGVNGMMAPNQAITGAAGQMGSNATNMWGAQQNAYTQAQASDNNLWGGLGSAAGSLAGAFLI